MGPSRLSSERADHGHKLSECLGNAGSPPTDEVQQVWLVGFVPCRQLWPWPSVSSSWSVQGALSEGLQGFRASCFSITPTAQPGQESCLGTAVMDSAELSVCMPDPLLAGARVDSRATGTPL